MQSEEVRSWEYETKVQDLWDWFGVSMTLLEVKSEHHEIEVCHMPNWFRGIMNQSRSMKLVEYWLEGSQTSLKRLWNWVCTFVKSSYQRSTLELNSFPLLFQHYFSNHQFNVLNSTRDIFEVMVGLTLSHLQYLYRIIHHFDKQRLKVGTRRCPENIVFMSQKHLQLSKPSHYNTTIRSWGYNWPKGYHLVVTLNPNKKRHNFILVVARQCEIFSESKSSVRAPLAIELP